MSLQLTDNFSNAVKNYISNPTKQINLATTVIRFAYYGAFFLGLFFVLIAFGLMLWNPNYRNGNSSKRPLIILGYVGIALILFSLLTTINSFYSVVGKINENIKVKKNCSLFQFENPVNAVNIIASENLKEQAIANVVNAEMENISQKTFVEKPFSGIADASTNSFTKNEVRLQQREGRPNGFSLTGTTGNPFSLVIGQINPKIKEEIISEIRSNSSTLKDILAKVYRNGDVDNKEASNIIGAYIEKTLIDNTKIYQNDGLSASSIEAKLKDALNTYLVNADGILKNQIKIPKPASFFTSIGNAVEEDIPKIIQGA